MSIQSLIQTNHDIITHKHMQNKRLYSSRERKTKNKTKTIQTILRRNDIIILIIKSIVSFFKIVVNEHG